MPAVAAPTPALPPLAPFLHDIVVTRRDSVRAREYTARGAIKILGDVEVEVGTVHDALSVGGRLTATRFSSERLLEVAGPVRVTEKLQLAGVTILEAGVEAGEFQARGAVRIGKDLIVREHLTTSGRLEVGGSVKATTIDFRGRVAIGGALEARIVDGRIVGPSRIGRIKAETVGIRTGKLFGGRPMLVVDRIEAATVDLEATEVEFVRAPTIRLGRDAHVVRFEGNVVHRHTTAHVGPESHSPRPHGLSR
ncbi:MAG: hypothetical protein L3K15_00535 [Thermoplasmata archaeon]|nr:hypothetical protein [Thermoplasmata archaeon]